MKIEMDSALQELIQSRKGTNKQYKSIANNNTLYAGLIRAYQVLESVDFVGELRVYSFLYYERLKHEYSGLSSVRLDNRYVHRLIFQEMDDYITLKLITIDDTHYGNKK